jgi:hypothetical protein
MNGQLTAEDQSFNAIRFCKEIPNDKATMMIARIIAFSNILQGEDYSSLEYLWDNPFDKIKFDGNFSITYSCLDYLNSNPDLPRKYGKGDQSITLSHWAGKEYEQQYGLHISQNFIVLCFLNSIKIGSYYEFGKVVNGSFGALFSEKTGISEMFQLSLKDSNQNQSENTILLEWDKNEKMISEEKLSLITKMRSLPVHKNAKELKTKWGNVPLVPDVKSNKELNVFFDRMLRIMSTRKKDEMIELLDLPLINQTKHRFGQVSFSNWKCQWGYFAGQSYDNYSMETLQGYAFAKNSDGMPTLYLEGSINFPDKFDGIPSLNEKGIIITFHSTGYPASYKTIVRNRLFGRQIEWNDKGEVISDVDLDIPKPWLDAPNIPTETEQSEK